MKAEGRLEWKFLTFSFPFWGGEDRNKKEKEKKKKLAVVSNDKQFPRSPYPSSVGFGLIYDISQCEYGAKRGWGERVGRIWRSAVGRKLMRFDISSASRKLLIERGRGKFTLWWGRRHDSEFRK